MLMWKNKVTVINDKKSRHSANFVSAALAQLPDETIRMRFPYTVTIGTNKKMRDLVNLQLRGTGPCALEVALRQIPCHTRFPPLPSLPPGEPVRPALTSR